MGMTPLAGMVMGTRSGDVDPGIPLHLAQVAAGDRDGTCGGCTGGGKGGRNELLSKGSGRLAA